MRIILPDDVKRHIRYNVLKRLIIRAFLEFAFGGVLILRGKQIFRTGSWPAFDIICYCVILIIPFVVCGVPFRLIDKTWYGIVEKVDIKTTYDNDQPYKPTLEHFYLKNTVYLTVNLPDKKKIVKRKVYAGRAKQQQHLNSYKNGDKVFHLYGTQHTIVMPSASEMHVQCAGCGTMNDMPNRNEDNMLTCHNCHLTLICDIE